MGVKAGGRKQQQRRNNSKGKKFKQCAIGRGERHNEFRDGYLDQLKIERIEKDIETLKEENKRLKKNWDLKYERTISSIKKMEWCNVCEAEAIYHCCWRTSYCSKTCQLEHWKNGHRQICRNERIVIMEEKIKP